MSIRLLACLGVSSLLTAALFADSPPAGKSDATDPAASSVSQPANAVAAESATAVPTSSPSDAGPMVVPAVDNGLVTLNVDDALISQIMNAFSRQTGRSIVVGPDVTGRTTVRLNGVPWDAALDAVLKPFGYGHYSSSNATVVCGTDVVIPRVFALKYLDAADVEDLVRSAMSPRGKFSKVLVRSQSWGAATEGGGTTMAGGNTMGKRQRSQENKDVARTKTILIVSFRQQCMRVKAEA